MIRGAVQALGGETALSEQMRYHYLKHSGEPALGRVLLVLTHSVGHCFDYLRQSFLCHADQALETAFNTSNGLQVDGMVERQCQNVEALFNFARKNQFS